MALLLSLLTLVSTFLGGLFALKRRDTLHLILGFSAGAVIGVAFFDLLPEALDLGGRHYAQNMLTTMVAAGFLFYMFLGRVLLLHPHASPDQTKDEARLGLLGAGSLSVHSFLDGVGMGLAFQVSAGVGAVVAAAVLTHDFSDGINTVGFVLKHKGDVRRAMRWLLIDAAAPVVGVLSTYFFRLSEGELGLLLAVFCGFFLYIGASDLLPESQHQHPQMVTSMLTLTGALVVFLAVHFASF